MSESLWLIPPIRAVKLGNSTHIKFPTLLDISWRRRKFGRLKQLRDRQLNSYQESEWPTRAGPELTWVTVALGLVALGGMV
jgi:hypothetical protein